MKKILSLLTIVCLLTACNKPPVAEAPKETTRTKKTTFRVYLDGNYQAPFYDSAYASVQLSIHKETLKYGVQELVWDTVLNRQRLRLYPVNVQPLIITKTLSGIKENEQRLHVSTVTRYDNQGANQFGSHFLPYAYGSDSFLVNVQL